MKKDEKWLVKLGIAAFVIFVITFSIALLTAEKPSPPKAEQERLPRRTHRPLIGMQGEEQTIHLDYETGEITFLKHSDTTGWSLIPEPPRFDSTEIADMINYWLEAWERDSVQFSLIWFPFSEPVLMGQWIFE